MADRRPVLSCLIGCPARSRKSRADLICDDEEDTAICAGRTSRFPPPEQLRTE